MKFIKILIIIFFSLFSKNVLASSDYFQEGLKFYEKKQFDKAKFKFEQDIVFNPKSENSYLYLSKIFKNKKNKDLEEKNLNTVILLNPKNEEALYNLAELKLKESDYKESGRIIKNLMIFCDKFCQKSRDLKVEIESSSKK